MRARTRRLPGAVAAFGVLATIAACGASAEQPPETARGARPSGQSRLMDETAAGKGSCDPKAHDRPFVLEWDATDASSFEARTATDVVFVRYQGCSLQVLDTCNSDSVKGSFGSYLPVEWTSGALEKIEIANEGELYAKLPLGVASLGGRVRAGERFQMEYFVSGTRRATRPWVYRREIDRIAGCRGVTHVVYAYNVGAFALGSLTKLSAGAGATLWGIGGGTGSSSISSAEKKGGVLTSCRAETAKEIATCRAPVRLTLRPIQEGDNPDAQAAVAPETPDAMNLAGKVQATTEREKRAAELATSAQSKLTAGDGGGCLRDLDEHDRVDPRPMVSSSTPKGLYAFMRAQCLMAAGKCDPGKVLARKYWEANTPANTPATAIDLMVDGMARQHCAK